MTTAPELWIVDPSLHHPEDQAVAGILEGWDGPNRVFRPGLVAASGPGPETGHDAAAVILLGSAASVHDAYPWLGSLGVWLRPILTGEVAVPLLAVCFGHQLVAHLAGGAVGFVREDRSKVLGVEWTELMDSRLLPGARRLRVAVSHRERVTRAPAGYRVTACRENAEIDGLEHPTLPLFSYQFHPEAREEFARRVGITVSLLDERQRNDSRRLLTAFLDVARDRRSPR
jgi:GMP synthase-like glutamine amidotransferase